MFGLPARHRECHCRDKRRGLAIVFSLQLSAVRFYDSADAVQTKTIMSLPDVAERFPSPILRFRRENRFWFMEAEQESPISDSGPCNQCALGAIVLESVGKKLSKYFLEQLRINIEYPALKFHVPCNLVVFFLKIALDL